MSEQDEEVIDDTLNVTEETENQDVEETAPEVETEDADKLRETNKRLFERTKKAEAELKALKAKPANIQSTNPQGLPDELKLIARGLSDEEIEQAKVISKGKDISLHEAVKDPLFLSFQKDLKETQRKEKAKLGASRGSGQQEEDIPMVDIHKPLSEQTEDHKKIWQQALGKK